MKKKDMLPVVESFSASDEMIQYASGLKMARKKKPTNQWGYSRYEADGIVHYMPFFSDGTRPINAVVDGKAEGNLYAFAVYRIEDLRVEAKKPRMVAFFDANEERYQTYFAQEEEFKSTLLQNSVDGGTVSEYHTYTTDAAREAFQALAKGEVAVNDEQLLKAVAELQLCYKHRKAKAAEEKLLSGWDEELKAFSDDVPERFRDFCRKNHPESFFIYEKKGRWAKDALVEGTCSACGTTFSAPSRKVVHVGQKRREDVVWYWKRMEDEQIGFHSYHEKTVDKSGVVRCPHCGKKLFSLSLKAINKNGTRTKCETFHLVERNRKDPMGFVSRLFQARLWVEKEGTVKVILYEIRRMVVDGSGNAEAFYNGVYKNGNLRWIKGKLFNGQRVPSAFWAQYFKDFDGRSYVDLRAFPDRKNQFYRTGVDHLVKMGTRSCPEGLIAIEKEAPILEKICKADLVSLTELLIWSHDYRSKKFLEQIDGSKAELAKALRIDNARLKRLRDMNGGFNELFWLQNEKKENTVYDDRLIMFFTNLGLTATDCSEFPSLIKAKNYMLRQRPEDPKAAWVQWKDYLSMARDLKFNLSSELLYYPKDLEAAHKKCIVLKSEKAREERIREQEQQFPHVRAILKSLARYGFTGKHFCFVIPEGIGDIMYDGDALNHCCGSSTRYYSRIEHRESFIAFVRRADTPDVPYYTCEFEPDGTVRQLRTTGDRQNPDIIEIREFLKKEWQPYVAKFLTEDDKKLQKESSRLREEEFKELKETGAKIRNGVLQGQLLFKVLQEDLMLAAKAEEELKLAAAM